MGKTVLDKLQKTFKKVKIETEEIRALTEILKDIHSEKVLQVKIVSKMLKDKLKQIKKGEELNKSCYQCQLLLELWQSAEQTDRNYWIMTELFVMLHHSDVCNGELSKINKAIAKEVNIKIKGIITNEQTKTN